ncbi:MAG: hypothetical protein JWM68_3502, partial [Verrucomicrobiales bacterium]|nr:hypothetical protein [Verrucomicrobiales bacterium]
MERHIFDFRNKNNREGTRLRNSSIVLIRKFVAIFVAGWMLFIATDLFSTEFYASPDGASNGDGSMTQPWDLRTALNTPAITPGDTVWLRGGIYRENNRVTQFFSTLLGTTNQPVTVRQFPGERATVDGNIMQTQGGYVNYWGFEILSSHPNRTTSEVGPFPSAFRVNYDGNLTDLAVSGFDL